MVQFRHAQKEIQFKVVYYGPALGGKTTNLEGLHEITDPEGETQLVSLKTSEDRTLFFDFLPFDLGEIQGYKIRVQVYTVPGQVHYNTTRKVVLAGADAIIFVADSQRRQAQENFVSWENLKDNLLTNRMDIAALPMIIQCNKQDLPDVLDAGEVLKAMRVEGLPALHASALTGEGVVETFVTSLQGAMAGFVGKFGLDKRGITVDQVTEGVTKVFARFEGKFRRDAKRASFSPLEAQVPVDGLSEEEQLIAALESSTRLAEQFQEAQQLTRLYQLRLEEMTVLHGSGIALSRAASVEDALRILPESIGGCRKGWTVSTFPGPPQVPVPLATFGASEDPLFACRFPEGRTAQTALLEGLELPRRVDLKPYFDTAGAEAPKGYGTAILRPLGSGGRILGYLVLYVAEEERFGEEEERFVELLMQVVNPRLLTLALMDDLALANEDLERRVVERTADLQDALERLKELDRLKFAFLNNVSHEVRTPLTNIRSYVDLLVRYPDQRDESLDEYLEIVMNEAKHLEQLLDDLLAYSRVKKPVTGSSTDLDAVLEDTMADLGPGFMEKRLDPLVKVSDESVTFTMNPQDASTLFRQILDNARKFSPEGSKIKAYLLQDDQKVVFAVRDYGPGFPTEQERRLLEPFEQGVPDLSGSKQPGLGMGLYLVKEVLHKYEGTISINAMNPGTNVVVEFPRREGR